MGRVIIYTEGLCYASACAPQEMTGEEVLADVIASHPSGTEGNWKLSSDATFRGGEPNPCQCEQDTSRRHWLLEC